MREAVRKLWALVARLVKRGEVPEYWIDEDFGP